jgi:glycerol-3-phosphate acyltransferase PlsY
LLLDIAKGSFAVLHTEHLMRDDPANQVMWMSVAALAVMAGHAYPVFLKFKGGKAVATFIGAFLVLTPIPMLATVLVFVIIVAASRYISAASVLCAAMFPLAVWMIDHPPAPVVISALIAGAFIVWRHKSNIERLRAGNESVFRWRRP